MSHDINTLLFEERGMWLDDYLLTEKDVLEDPIGEYILVGEESQNDDGSYDFREKKIYLPHNLQNYQQLEMA